MSSSKKIRNGIIIGIGLLVISLFVNEAWNDYAYVGFNLSAAKWAYTGEDLEVHLRLRNTGNLDVVPVSTVRVKNATIRKVSIRNVAEYQLSRYCFFNDTATCVGNLTLTAGRELGEWFSVYVVPDEDATSFVVYSDVTISQDMWHPKNRIIRILPYELTYNATSYPGQYKLLD